MLLLKIIYSKFEIGQINNYLARHDQPIWNANQNYTVEVHNVISDKILFKIKDRFTGN